MSDAVIPVPEAWKKRAFMTAAQYADAYAESVRDPDGYWRKEAARLDWATPFNKVKNVRWDPQKLDTKCVEDGALNVSANCSAGPRPKRAARPAVPWHAQTPADTKHISYSQLHQEVC